MIPTPYEFILLALTAFSIWKLIGDDVVLDRPRDWILRKLANPDGRPFRRGGRDRAVYWGAFLECPWCAGFWISGLVYIGWLILLGSPGATAGSVVVGIGIWFALRAVVGLLGTAWSTLADLQDD